MSRSILIMVSDNLEAIETAQKHYQGNTEVTLQIYTSSQWREGIESPFFRQQLSQGVPALASGSSPFKSEEGQLIAFPGNRTESHVERMDDVESKAIENAILQFNGNLTEAAKALGIGRATLYRKVKQYHIDPGVARKKRMAA